MNRKRIVLALVAIALIPIAWLSFRFWQWNVTPIAAPLIGVSSDTAWHSRFGLSNTTYQASLALAGAQIWEFRPGDATVEEILARVDAVLIAGGGDVSPLRYAGDPTASSTPDLARDELELALIEAALARDVPLLGICRGVQILNVAHGGSLRNLREDAERGPAHGGRVEWDHLHEVRLVPDTHLAEIERVTTKGVNSFHGQAVGRVGEGLVAAALAPDDVVEAIERPDKRFVIGVQWHPEILAAESPKELRILEALVAAAEAYRRERRDD